jgi:hypothetical protein
MQERIIPSVLTSVVAAMFAPILSKLKERWATDRRQDRYAKLGKTNSQILEVKKIIKQTPGSDAQNLIPPLIERRSKLVTELLRLEAEETQRTIEAASRLTRPQQFFLAFQPKGAKAWVLQTIYYFTLALAAWECYLEPRWLIFEIPRHVHTDLFWIRLFIEELPFIASLILVGSFCLQEAITVRCEQQALTSPGTPFGQWSWWLGRCIGWFLILCVLRNEVVLVNEGLRSGVVIWWRYALWAAIYLVVLALLIWIVITEFRRPKPGREVLTEFPKATEKLLHGD